MYEISELENIASQQLIEITNHVAISRKDLMEIKKDLKLRPSLSYLENIIIQPYSRQFNGGYWNDSEHGLYQEFIQKF